MARECWAAPAGYPSGQMFRRTDFGDLGMTQECQPAPVEFQTGQMVQWTYLYAHAGKEGREMEVRGMRAQLLASEAWQESHTSVPGGPSPLLRLGV
mmetsp:Transcript_84985/g.148820  ORF Transcript_84985/g.148820 Transcript_84985/m.148820 type:complete len:96 (+) Transcript_84985:1018-1305(+)